MRKILCTSTMALLCCMATLSIASTNGTAHYNDPPSDITETATIKFRLNGMNCPINAKYDIEVASYLKRYLSYDTEGAEKMLGKGTLYFPIFEHYLDLYGLPKQLKYLPMVESGMVPYAVSYSGAAGLWQFMPATGKHLGLIIDKYIDERKDPYKSSEAAVKYLKKLYENFDTWELALAAYNCGPGRLGKTIEEYGSMDFSKIKKGLPKETQHYVSRFVAACYIGTFYHLHGLSPKMPGAYCMRPMVARIYCSVSLKNISSTIGIGIATLRELNPSFKMDYSPARSGGIFLVLPKKSWYEYLDTENKKKQAVVARP